MKQGCDHSKRRDVFRAPKKKNNEQREDQTCQRDMTIEMTGANETMAGAAANTIARTANRAKAGVVLKMNATGIPAKTDGAVNPAADIRPGWVAITSLLAKTMAKTIESMAVNGIPATAVPDPDTARKAVD